MGFEAFAHMLMAEQSLVVFFKTKNIKIQNNMHTRKKNKENAFLLIFINLTVEIFWENRMIWKRMGVDMLWLSIERIITNVKRKKCLR